MSQTSRPRAPNIFAIIQIIFRLGALATAIAGLIVLAKLAIAYRNAKYYRGITFGGSISTVQPLFSPLI